MTLPASIHAPQSTAEPIRLARPRASVTAIPARPAADESIELFGFSIANTTIKSAARWLVGQAKIGRHVNAAFINAHCVNVAFRNPSYRAALEGMDSLFGDGIGVRIAARVAGKTLNDNVNGTDLFPVLCKEAAASGLPIYLLGGSDGIAGRTAARMSACTPGLAVAGTRSGYFMSPAEEAEAIAEINRSPAKILLVGMGVPLQEEWIARNRHRIEAPVIIGVGGLFDYYSGRIPRAPLALRRLGLEWTWRLAMEPTRLARRYLLGNVEFLVRLGALRLLAPTVLSSVVMR